MTTIETNYTHLDSLAIGGFIKSYIGFSPQTAKDEMFHVAHPIYEGLLEFMGENVIFFLQKPIPDFRTLQEVEGVMDEVVSGQRYNNLDKGQLTRNFVPRDLWKRGDVAISAALFGHYSQEAEIIVPGIVTGRSVRGDTLVSKVRSVPYHMRQGLEKNFRKNDFNGPLEFR